MKKVVESCYPLDKKCYVKYHLSEDILMEHAGLGMANVIREKFTSKSTLLIVVGVGNNGADGLVLARQLYKSYKVKIYIPFELKSEMARLQLKRLLALGIKPIKKIKKAEIVVDALLGAGSNRALNEKTQEIIKKLNRLKSYKIACDIPTGLNQNGVVFLADFTVTMGARKAILYEDKHKDSVGKIVCVDLGIHHALYENNSASYLLEKKDLKLPLREKKNSHKGDFGHLAVFCGKKEGASLLSAMSASTFGVGLTTLIAKDKKSIPYYLMQATSVPPKSSALAIGMGLGDSFSELFLKQYVIESSLPIVLDADAFYHPILLEILNQRTREIVLTPHPKEFASMWFILTKQRLSIKEIQDNRFGVVRKFSKTYPHVTLLLKGANMLIIQKSSLYINSLGSSILAKGGSGDVLSGLIGALLAQGYKSLDATIQASLAFSLASKKYKKASYALLPTDLIECVAKLE